MLSPFLVPIAICVLPAPPLNGTLLTNSQNTDQTESSVITFQCDPGFSLVGTETATCNNSGLWDPDPALLECKFIYVLMHVCAVYDLYRCDNNWCMEFYCFIWRCCCSSGDTDRPGPLSIYYHTKKKK